MPSARKPRPKSQKEISNDQINPYEFPGTGESYGNSNIPSDFRQFTNNNQSGLDFNRSEKLSLKGDKVKQFTVGLQDIDESIMYYFTNVVRPYVYQNGNRIEVPIIYGSPEKWKSVQKDGYYKDKNGAIMAPLIMFKRDTIEKNRSLTNKLDANAPHLYASWKSVYNQKNAYSNFNVLTNRKPVEQFIVNVVPDYVTLMYNCSIQTYYFEQLNKIIEAINYASDSYWGDAERFKFKATIDSYSTSIDVSDSTNRIVKGTFTLKLFGYIIPDNIQKELNSIKKYNSKAQVIIGLEVEGVGEEFLTSKNKKTPVIFAPSPSEVDTNPLNQATITYLNSNTTLNGTIISPDTATFPAGWLVSPPTLPPTSISDFIFYVNGVLINEFNIISFTQNNNVSTLVINSTSLGYSLSATDTITAIGKFNV